MTDSNQRLVVTRLSKQLEPPTGPVVLREVSLSAEPGEFVAIVGPSGSGKSTLLNLVGSLDQPTSGTMTLGDCDVGSLDAHSAARYRATRVGFVFQDHHLLPQLTAEENVLLPTLADAAPPLAPGRARALLARVGLPAHADAFPSRLSGGERQRVAIARAMVHSPQLLLCDEPTGNLDRDNALRVADLFATLARDDRVIILMVTHNLELAARCHRCLRLANGTLS